MSATRGVETGLEGNDIIYPLNSRLRTEVCARTVMKATRCIDIFESVMGCGSERCYAACRDSTQRIRATQLIADVSWHRRRRVSEFFENVLCPLSDTYSRLRPALSVSLSRSNELGRGEGRIVFWVCADQLTTGLGLGLCLISPVASLANSSRLGRVQPSRSDSRGRQRRPSLYPDQCRPYQFLVS